MNLLEKGGCRNKSDNRISEADRHFCEIQQQAYHEAKEELQKIYDQWKSMSERQKELLSPIEDSYSTDKYIRLSNIVLLLFCGK